jgi:hypothetical protein
LLLTVVSDLVLSWIVSGASYGVTVAEASSLINLSNEYHWLCRTHEISRILRRHCVVVPGLSFGENWFWWFWLSYCIGEHGLWPCEFWQADTPVRDKILLLVDVRLLRFKRGQYLKYYKTDSQLQVWVQNFIDAFSIKIGSWYGGSILCNLCTEVCWSSLGSKDIRVLQLCLPTLCYQCPDIGFWGHWLTFRTLLHQQLNSHDAKLNCVSCEKGLCTVQAVP